MYSSRVQLLKHSTPHPSKSELNVTFCHHSEIYSTFLSHLLYRTLPTMHPNLVHWWWLSMHPQLFCVAYHYVAHFQKTETHHPETIALNSSSYTVEYFAAYILYASPVLLMYIAEDNNATVYFTVRSGRRILHNKFSTVYLYLMRERLFDIRRKNIHQRFCTYVDCTIQLFSLRICTGVPHLYCGFYFHQFLPRELTKTPPYVFSVHFNTPAAQLSPTCVQLYIVGLAGSDVPHTGER